MERAILLTILFFLSINYTLSQEQIRQKEITLRYSNCNSDLAVFVLENRSKKNIYARVQPVPYWQGWKKAQAQYGTFTAEYKALASNIFADVSDMFDAPGDFTTIRPNMKIRYGIPLRKGAGVYKISVPYIDNLKMKKTLDNFANLSSEEINKILWKQVFSKETLISCK